MLRQLLNIALSIAASEIRASLRDRRKLAQPARTTRAAVAIELCEECGRAGKRACPKCGRRLCGRCACPCKRTRPAQSMVQTRAPTVTPAPRTPTIAPGLPPAAFSVNHRVGLGTVREVCWHAAAQAWTYRLEWSNGASAWLLERDLLRYTKISP